MGFIQILYKPYIGTLSNCVLKFLVPSSSPKEFLSPGYFLGIHIILDLTPNYKGQNAWFLPPQADIVATKMKVRFYGWWHIDAGDLLCGFIHSKPRALSVGLFP